MIAYQASNMVTVRVREVGKLGAVIDALTAAGGEPALRRRLRGLRAAGERSTTRARKAVADARAKAELFAARRRGHARAGPLDPRERRHGRSGADARPRRWPRRPPVAEGTVTLTAEVEVVYAIE